MLRSLIVVVRLAIVLVFLLGMPVLAIPAVADWCEARLYPRPVRRQVIARSTPAPRPAVVTVAHHDWPGESLPVRAAEYVTPAATLPAVQPSEPAAVDLESLAADLRSLGATFYRLEQLQEQPPIYRFTAQFEKQGDLPHRQHYSATHADPAAAMQDVVEQFLAHN